MEEKIIAAVSCLDGKVDVSEIIYDETRDILEIDIDSINRLTDSDIRRVKEKAGVKGLILQ